MIAVVVADIQIALRAIVFQAGGTALANAPILVSLLNAVAQVVLIQQRAADTAILRYAAVAIATGGERRINVMTPLGNIVAVRKPLAER